MKKLLLLLFFFTPTLSLAVTPGFSPNQSTSTPCISVDDNAVYHTEFDCIVGLGAYSNPASTGIPKDVYLNQNNDARGFRLYDNFTCQGAGTSPCFAGIVYYKNPAQTNTCFANLLSGQYFGPNGEQVTNPTDEQMYSALSQALAQGGAPGTNVYGNWSACQTAYNFSTSTDFYLKSEGIADFSSHGTSTNPPPPCTVDCYSNVLFLPGIMGSRLYEDSNGLSLERWANVQDSYQERLSMDSNGHALNNLYTKPDTKGNTGITDEVGVFGTLADGNIYKSFMSDLQDMKASSTIGIDYALIPYDWRLPLDQIVAKGKVVDGKLYYGTSTSSLSDSFIVKELQRLADTSKSKKVTIIAHSNGGLVAKELIQELKETNNPLYDKIDKIIFVGVPQAGTPDAVLNLLHGSDIGPSFLPYVSAERGRGLAQNMPMAYHLLPNESLVNNVSPIIEFDKNVVPTNIYNAYGATISSYQELESYLRGDEGRIQPIYEDINNPSKANSSLLAYGKNVHDRIDNFEPATSTKIIEIAGWGLYTPTGIRYGSTQKCKVRASIAGLFTCIEYELVPTLNEKVTLNGDKTVVAGSALAMDTSSTTEKYWVNLEEYNNDNPFETAQFNGVNYLAKKHANILEIPSLRNFLKSKLLNYSTQEQYISTSEPVSSSVYTKYTLHSPLNISVVDSQGNVTSSSTSTLTNAYYYQLGDSKTIIVPSATPHTLKLDAYASGSFSLDIEKIQGDTTIVYSSYQAVPTSTSTKASLDWNSSSNATNTLKVDFDGNGSVDTSLVTSEGQNTVYDPTPPELRLTFSTSTKQFTWKAIDNFDPNPSITVGTSTIKAVDNQGNTNLFTYKPKYEDKSLKLDISSISRNGILTPTNISLKLEYSLDNKTNQIKELEYKVTMNNQEMYKIKYQKETNLTTIKSPTGTLTKTGLQVPTFITNLNTLITG